MAPKSDIIWNVATAVPPRALLPTMSATAACCGEMKMPVAAPVTKAAARNSGSDVVKPTSTVVTAATVSPMMQQHAPAHPVGQVAAGDHHRDVADRERRQRQPADARRRGRSTSTTNSGTSAIRRPNADQPVAKFENSAAR